jgi:hypothetical protein
MQAREIKRLSGLGLAVALTLSFPACRRSTGIHVSPTGDATGDGSEKKPFASVEQALAQAAVAAKAGENATVWLADGDYAMDAPLAVGAAHSGKAGNPVVVRAIHPRKARFTGGRKLLPTDFTPANAPGELERMRPEVRGRIVCLDLEKIGVKHLKRYPDVFTDWGGIVDLICGGKRMTLSRFPNDGSMTVRRVIDNAGGPRGDWRDPSNIQKAPPGSKGGVFKYRDEFHDRHAIWARVVDRGVWFKGYWRVAWENPAIRVDSIDTENRTVTFAKPIHNGIGNKYTRPEGNGRESYWVMNLLEEIDEPGEWCIDFKDRKLYLLPPEGFAESEILLLDRSEPVISLNDASNIVLRELLVEGNLGDGIRVTGGSNNLIAGCEVRNVNRYAVVLDGRKNHRVLSSDLHHLGAGGVWLGGGDDTVDPPVSAGHEVVNNHIHHFGRIERVYAPGVNSGFTGGGGGGHHTAVGMRVAHNLIHDTPHGGVLFGSLNSLFEYNEVFRYCLVSNDLGAFYSYDYHKRGFGGHTFRYNLIHSSEIGDGIYFDHDHSNMKVHGNIVRLGSSGKRGTAFLFKKGDLEAAPQDIDCWNNIAIDCRIGFEFVSKLPNKGRIENNVVIACQTPMTWSDIVNGAQVPAPPYPSGTNAVYKENPGFKNIETLDFQLKPDAPLRKDLPGFERIPVGKIGLFVDEYRKQLPDPRTTRRFDFTKGENPGLKYDILDRTE